MSMSRMAAPSAPATTGAERATATTGGNVCYDEHAEAHAGIPDPGPHEAGIVNVAAGETPVAATIHGQVRGEAGCEREDRPIGAGSPHRHAREKVVGHEQRCGSLR